MNEVLKRFQILTTIIEEKSDENDADFGRIWIRRRGMRMLPKMDERGNI
ncbi:MAG: hypothetical protein JXA22_05970 [Candidatus Thermoplasmatota archaeon]|nr:hypothetical protein [Candidatus Thermoplasmatota archaeon]